VIDAEFGGAPRVTLRAVGGGAEVPLGHEVGVDVVVGDRAVLVGSGNAVDPKPPGGVVVPERSPQPGGLDEESEADPALERFVAAGRLVADDSVGDVGVDVERRGAGGPVARALLSADRPPRERRAPQAQLPGALLGEIERQASPAQRVCHDVRSGVGQHRQDKRLGVPERVALVAWAGKPLCGDRSLLPPGTCLKGVK
jgi:hypothetical protein